MLNKFSTAVVAAAAAKMEIKIYICNALGKIYLRCNGNSN